MICRNAQRKGGCIRHLPIISTFTVLLSVSGLADTIRVTSWNLKDSASASAAETNHIEQAADVMRKLDPDVILLRQVRDWQTCARLALALKPSTYNVLVCSAFRDPKSGLPGPDQVAILAKKRAYISWSGAWRSEESSATSGGFAFAGIRTGKRRIGFFSVQVDSATTQALARQWAAQLDSLSKWTTNRIEAVVIAGGVPQGIGPDFQRTSLKELSSAESFLAAPLARALAPSARDSTRDSPANPVLVRLAPNTKSLTGVILGRCPDSFDLDLDPANDGVNVDSVQVIAQPVAPPAQEAQNASSNAVASVPSLPTSLPTPPGRGAQPRTFQHVALLAILWGLPAVAIAVTFLARRKSAVPAQQLLPAAPDTDGIQGKSSETVVIVSRTVTAAADSPTNSASSRPAIHIDAPAGTQTQSGRWQPRGSDASREAQDAHALARSGLFALWSQWLKEKLVRRLIADRAEMLNTQQAATLKAIAVDERLARIELQLQNQNRAYERRIEDLTRELAAAKEGSRELIRAQIAQVKAEMETARTRLMAQMQSRGES